MKMNWFLGLLTVSVFSGFDLTRSEAQESFDAALRTVSENAVLIRSVVSENGNYGFCSGVVLNPTTILTAAHCIDGNEKHEIEISGRFYRRWVKASSKYMSPDYNVVRSPSYSDIGVLVFSEALPYETIPICENDHGEEVLMQSGYGWRDGGRARTEIYFTSEKVRSKSKLVTAYDSLAVAGDSGAPIYALENGDFCLYAIHSSVSAPFYEDGSPNALPRQTFNPIVRKTNLPIELF